MLVKVIEMLNSFILLLKHDLNLVKNRIYVYFLFFFFPVLLILFFSIPLSFVFTNYKPIYLIWSTTGVCVVSTLIFSFIVTMEVFLKRQKNEFIFSVPIRINSYILSFYFFSLLISFFEFSFSIFLINSLNNYFLSFLDCLIIFFLLIPAILFITSFIFFFGPYLRENIDIVVYVFFFFIFLAFGLGAFFPLNIYPEFYMNSIQFFPIGCSIINIQRVISAENIYFSFLIISFLYSVIFIFISYIIYNSKIKERLY